MTKQTSLKGARYKPYFTEGSDIDHEYYLALVLDRESAQTDYRLKRGGKDIEAVAEKPREKSFEFQSIRYGLKPHTAA